MTPRKTIARPVGVRALGEAVELPDSLRRGLVWAPDLSTGMDPVSGNRGTFDGTTYSAGVRTFNGTTDRVDWPNVRNFGAASRPNSGSMWIRPSSVAVGLAILWTDSLGVGGPSQSVIFRRNADTIEVAHASSATGLQRIAVSAALVVNTWTHVGWSIDGSLTAAGVQLYIAGVVSPSYQTSTNQTGTPRGGDGLWCLGGRAESDANCFAGRIRLPFVWDRVLSAAEFATLPRFGRPT
jgi:hypothetical protein